MNSNAIGVLIRWFVKLNPLPDDDKYKIKIIFSKDIIWQEKGLKPLLKLAPGLIELVQDQGL